MGLFSFLSPGLNIDTHAIEQAIAAAEKQTSAELRVVVERKAKGSLSALERANQLFDELKMRETAERNGVLIYLAFKPHLLAVVGDEGIHQKVGEAFWQEVYAAMKQHCAQENFTQAIVAGISQVGAALGEHFPLQANDRNELENEVVIR